MNSETPPKTRLRLWPALVVLALAAVAIGIVWSDGELQHQRRNIKTAAVLLGSGALLLLWFLFFSRLRWKVRFAGLGVLALIALTVPLCFRIRGVSGDLLPILEPRWAARPVLATGQPASPPTKAAVSIEGEFPQFYGPGRNAVIPGPPLDPDWSAHPPRIVWKQPIGAAWSGFAIKDGLAVTLEQRGESECVVCYDLLTGATVWTQAKAGKYSTTIAGEGPRTTPTIVSNRVYTFGATGMLNCFDLASGKVVWTRDAAAENSAHLPDWGFASSPLVTDGKVIVAVGGSDKRSVVAYSQDDGKVVWADGEGGADYSSPEELSIAGMPQIVVFAGSVSGRDRSGKTLWTYPWPGGHPHITPPLLVDTNLLWVASGYGTGSELLQIDRDASGQWKASRVWKGIAPKSKFGPLFRLGESLYGLDDGIFCCVDLKTGARKWKDGRYGHGQGLLVGEQILLTSEKGELVLIQPDPEKLVELARFKVFGDKTWNPPAVVGEYVLMRNDKEAACIKVQRQKRA